MEQTDAAVGFFCESWQRQAVCELQKFKEKTTISGGRWFDKRHRRETRENCYLWNVDVKIWGFDSPSETAWSTTVT